ncbi:MAG: hypothetical protein AAFY82_06095 [Pseudomonadota bacterium]
MKRAHRTSHLVMWLVLAPVLLGLLWLALLVRPDAPVNDPLPEALIEEAR